MNTINNRFSFSRFAAVLKCDLMENWMRYVGVFCILFFANLAFQLVDLNDVVELYTLRALPVEDYMGKLANDCVPLFYGVLALSLMCAAADMTAVPFKTKGRALNYLMIPATKLEKFLSRTFINVVLVLVMAYVALFLADLARMLCAAASNMDGFYGFTIPTVWSELIETFSYVYENGGVGFVIVNGVELRPDWEMSMGVMAVAALVLSAFYVHSVILLGGCVWRKGALLKTIASVLVISLLFLWIIAHIIPSLEPWFVDVVEPWAERTFVSQKAFNCFLFSVGIPLMTAFTTLHWWLAYRLFSRKQAVAPQHCKKLHQLFSSRK